MKDRFHLSYLMMMIVMMMVVMMTVVKPFYLFYSLPGK